MAKKNSFTVAEQLLQGNKINSPTTAAAKPAPAGKSPAPITPTQSKTLSKPTATSSKNIKNLNIAFNADNYKYLKLIALQDETNVTAYINKLVDADRKKRQADL